VKPQKLAFETRYGDDSGVEYAVRYDATATALNGSRGVLELHNVHTIKFPAERLDWLLACLTEIKKATAAGESAAATA
jgi:hypothetical protein